VRLASATLPLMQQSTRHRIIVVSSSLLMQQSNRHRIQSNRRHICRVVVTADATITFYLHRIVVAADATIKSSSVTADATITSSIKSSTNASSSLSSSSSSCNNQIIVSSYRHCHHHHHATIQSSTNASSSPSSSSSSSSSCNNQILVESSSSLRCNNHVVVVVAIIIIIHHHHATIKSSSWRNHVSEAVSLVDSNRADVIQNLDYDDDDEKADDESGDSTAQPLGVQREYVKAIQQRLQYEIKDNDKLVENWLLNLLDGNDWWIRKCHVPKVLKKLQMKANPLAYYRDIYVWLPDVRCCLYRRYLHALLS
jgi:hypothetical protein